MSFRRPKSDQHLEDRAWRDWLSRNATAIRTIGLPPEVTLSREHWWDFLQNGYLELHPESRTGFTFHQLSPERIRGLLLLLEGSPEFAVQPLAGWLRARLGTR
jgi:hypothetical protein